MPLRFDRKWMSFIGLLAMIAGSASLSGCASPPFASLSGLNWTRSTPTTDGPPLLASSSEAGVSGLDRIPQPSPHAPLVATEHRRSPEAPPEFPDQRDFLQARLPELAPAAQPEVLHVNSSTFDRHVLQSEVPVLVDFYADWCGPCKALAPTLDQVAAENPQARVVKVNIDDSPDLAARYGVKSVPRLMVFKRGQVAANRTGAASKAALNAMLASSRE
jgi:thioredoxin